MKICGFGYYEDGWGEVTINVNQNLSVHGNHEYAILWAIASGNKSIVSKILSRKDFDLPLDKNGQLDLTYGKNPFLWAISYPNYEIWQLIVQHYSGQYDLRDFLNTDLMKILMSGSGNEVQTAEQLKIAGDLVDVWKVNHQRRLAKGSNHRRSKGLSFLDH